MSFASKHNKGSKFDISIDGFEFKKLKDLEMGKVYPMLGIYINSKGDFAAHPVAISDGILVDLPPHLTEEVQEMLKDDEDVKAIVDGHVGFKVYSYVSKKYGKQCYSVNWVDME